MGVDEPGEYQAFAQVDDLLVRVRGEHVGGRTTGHDDPVAHHDGGVGLRAQVVALEGALRSVEEGAAKGRHR